MAVPVVKYSLEITTSAQKELDSIDDPLFERIDRKILALADDPRPAGSKKLKGFRGSWRIRVGDWRVVYVLDDAAKLVTVTRVAHRREVYDR
jgi:mRNA interferase RelE/StbE